MFVNLTDNWLFVDGQHVFIGANMGGNIFNTKRVQRSEYLKISKKILNQLQSNFEGNFLIPLEIKEKKDFGDVDILSTNLPDKEDIEKVFQTKNIRANKSFLSFEYKNLQVDLIHVEPENLEYQFQLNSFGDLNMLLGILTKRLGVKLSSKGIFYVKEINGQHVNFLLSKNYLDVFDMLKIPYGVDIFNRALLGETLKNEEDIFEFVMSSPYFDSSYFMEKNFNAKHRARNKSRKMILNFQRFLKKRGVNYIYNPEIAYGKKTKQKDQYFSELIVSFPDLLDRIQKYEVMIQERKRARKIRLGH